MIEGKDNLRQLIIICLLFVCIVLTISVIRYRENFMSELKKIELNDKKDKHSLYNVLCKKKSFLGLSSWESTYDSDSPKVKAIKNALYSRNCPVPMIGKMPSYINVGTKLSDNTITK